MTKYRYGVRDFEEFRNMSIRMFGQTNVKYVHNARGAVEAASTITTVAASSTPSYSRPTTSSQATFLAVRGGTVARGRGNSKVGRTRNASQTFTNYSTRVPNIIESQKS
ncbi:conserved hypothetical protein [Ricinus communis]|uniref:Uncharacterized protein n=1 Tax=Ricinus communis TaxID=3988 RepID=B9RQ10_RICCO|nr:conserved hypothetical protein [Ricinus communis]